MFANKQKLPKIKCIITGQIDTRRAWYNCPLCCINYGSDIFNKYDIWTSRPRCAICDGFLNRKSITLFAPHRRR